MLGQPRSEICVPTGRKEVVVEVLAKETGVTDLVTFRVWTGRKPETGKNTPVGLGGSPDVGNVLFVPFSVGNGKNPLRYVGLPVAFTEARGRRPEAVTFKIGGGRRPDTDALKFVVKFTVGNGNRPDLGKVEFEVEFAVG